MLKFTRLIASSFIMNTIPNYLTFSRILLIPLFIFLFLSNITYGKFFSALIFSLIALTDFLDGYLARNLNQTSKFGAFLDPVADKITVSSALIILVSFYDNLLVTIPSLLIITREITISALREWMAHSGQSKKVEVSYIGKIKTTMQMIAIIILLANLHYLLNYIGFLVLFISALLTISSLFKYLKSSMQSFS